MTRQTIQGYATAAMSALSVLVSGAHKGLSVYYFRFICDNQTRKKLQACKQCFQTLLGKIAEILNHKNMHLNILEPGMELYNFGC